MEKLAKNVKFAIVSAVVGFAAAALVAACGGAGQLDYPEDWPDEFAQQVHNEFDGFFNGVRFTDPLPPTEATLATLKDSYDEFMCCFFDPFAPRPPGPPSPIGRVYGYAYDRYGDLIRPWSPDGVVFMFLSGGYEFRQNTAPPILIPFDEIMWLEMDLYMDVLVAHYKLGGDSQLCDLALAEVKQQPIWAQYNLGDRRGYFEWWCPQLNFIVHPSELDDYSPYDEDEYEQTGPLDYPRQWPDKFAQAVHHRYEGLYEGVEFGQTWGPTNPDGTSSGDVGPPPPNSDTLNTLLKIYTEFSACFPQFCKLFEYKDTEDPVKVAQVENARGETIDIWADGVSANEMALEFFLAGGYQLPSETAGESEFIPFDQIKWLAGWIYIDILVHNYTKGSDSVLCDIAIREEEGARVGWYKLIQEFEDFCSRPPST